MRRNLRLIRRRALRAMASAGDHGVWNRRAASPYRRRALEYWRLDRLHAERSRFLAAASIVSYVLDSVEPYAFFVVGRPGVRLLSQIGARLSTLNLGIVGRLSGIHCGISFDEHWVRLEQTAVQDILRGRQAHHPDRFAASMRGIDRLLAFAGWELPIGSSPALLLSDAVRTVAKAQRTPLEFANQEHRERIGMRLIDTIRGVGLSS